jgi:Na+-driven multidrug efflux pump
LEKGGYSNNLIELPFSKIFFRLAVPNLFSTIIASATTIFDLWYVGQIGIPELAGVAYIFPIYMLASMLSNGAFGGAVSGATARAFGSKNIFKAECIFRSAILIALVGALLMMTLFFGLAQTLFSSLSIDQEITTSALTYGRILLGGIVLIWLFNIVIAITRGSGNTLIPAISWLIVLIFHILAASINFEYKDGELILLENVKIFSDFFIFNSLEWSAISFLLGYLAGIFFVFIFYYLGKHPFSFNVKNIFRIDGIKALLKSGSLASCQSIMTIILAMFCIVIISTYGINWTAGFGIAIRLELLLIPIIFGIGGALIAIVGANVGAKKYNRAIIITWKGTSFSVFIVGIIGLFFSVFPDIWSSFFTNNIVIKETAKSYLEIVAPFYAFFALGLGLYFTCQAFKIDYSSFNNSYSISFRSCESSFIISYNVFRSNRLWNFYCSVSSFWTLETLLQSIIILCFKV